MDCMLDLETLGTDSNSAIVSISAVVFNGVKHRGVDDCKHQIKYCVDAFRILGV